MNSIQFFSVDVKPTLSHRNNLKLFIQYLFQKEKIKLQSLSYIFCTDAYLLEINKKYLSHNFFTDIITFELNQKDMPVEGEIYISVERVKENAYNLGFSFKEEFHRVIFHGALHLCGYKDKSKVQQEMMRATENKYIKRYFNNM